MLIYKFTTNFSLDIHHPQNYILAHEYLWTDYHRSESDCSKPGSSPSYYGAVQRNQNLQSLKPKTQIKSFKDSPESGCLF